MAKPSNVNMAPGGGGGARGVRGAMRGKKTSKGLAPTEYQDVQKLTTGRAKAITRNVKIEKFGADIAKGKNKNFAKNANKTTLPSATKSKRANAKEANLNSRLSKHPLVKNAGEASAETKYRVNRGNSVPVKPNKAKATPKTAAKGAAFGKKPAFRGGGMLGGGLNRTNR
jgi:hypothetical protein